MDKPAACRHCSHPKVTRPRGLCWSCYSAPAVRRLYPPGGGNPATAKFAPQGEPTAAELEATIAEQSRPENLPPWWWREARRERGPYTPRVVKLVGGNT